MDAIETSIYADAHLQWVSLYQGNPQKCSSDILVVDYRNKEAVCPKCYKTVTFQRIRELTRGFIPLNVDVVSHGLLD